MRKVLTAALAALTLGGSLAATTAADARPYGYGGYHHDHRGRDVAGPAIAAGVVGLALGAALAGNSHSQSYSYGYNYPSYGYAPGYGSGYGYGYAPGYYGGYAPRDGYGYGYGMCERGHWGWDGWGRRVWVRETYPC